MQSNWGARFFTDGYDDHIENSAVTIVQILEAPGRFMLEVGVTDEDLEAEEPAIMKVVDWLKRDYEGSWL